MRIGKTSGRSNVKAPKKPARAAAAKGRSKARRPEVSTASGQALARTPQPSQLSGLKLALQRLAQGVAQLPSQPLSGTTAQAALAGLRE